MRKLISLLVIALLLISTLTGCGAKKQAPFTSENEILTYTKIDPNKTQLTVSSLGNNVNTAALSAAFERQNPDIQVICLDLTNGANVYRPVVDWVEHGAAPGIMFVNPDTFSNNAWIIKHFEDLSTYPAVENFEAEAINRCTIDGFAYFLPAPSEINCITYNKTMFERYGWEVPASFDDFIALCLQIREDTDGVVQPWNPNAKYENVFSIATEAFTYEELFGGSENRTWYKDFCKGSATFAGHMEPFYAMLQTLIDHKILLEEHFTYSATARGEEFLNGQIAMYNAPISLMNSTDYKFSYMPYPTTKGELGYVSDFFSGLLCVPKKEHSDAQQKAIDRYIEFFSSVEGQQALIGNTLKVSNVKDVPLNDAEAMKGIEEVISQGHKFTRLDFSAITDSVVVGESAPSNTSNSVYRTNWTIRGSALEMVKGEKTGAAVIAEIDAKPYITAQEAGEAQAVKLAEVTEDFSILDFSFYIADTYREKTNADIALVGHQMAFYGNLIRLFKGDIYDTYLTPIKPRSFSNKSTLIKVSMTGQQLMDALNNPLTYNKSSADAIYAYSGLKCDVAPWNKPGTKYLSVKLANGSTLELDTLYTVAFWEGAITDEYITEKLEAYNGTWEELMAAKFKSDGTVAPAKDGRIKLIWEK